MWRRIKLDEPIDRTARIPDASDDRAERAIRHQIFEEAHVDTKRLRRLPQRAVQAHRRAIKFDKSVVEMVCPSWWRWFHLGVHAKHGAARRDHGRLVVDEPADADTNRQRRTLKDRASGSATSTRWATSSGPSGATA
jgi:hypothetical protein